MTTFIIHTIGCAAPRPKRINISSKSLYGSSWGLTTIKIGIHKTLTSRKSSIDYANRIIYIAEKPVELTDKEYELSVFLFRNIGRLLSRGHISESVWGRTSDVQSRTVDTHVSRIRKKLDFGVKRGVRLTPIYNFGYRLERVGALPPSEFGNAVQ